MKKYELIYDGEIFGHAQVSDGKILGGERMNCYRIKLTIPLVSKSGNIENVSSAMWVKLKSGERAIRYVEALSRRVRKPSDGVYNSDRFKDIVRLGKLGHTIMMLVAQSAPYSIICDKKIYLYEEKK